jgi:hypothetical protein
MESSLIDAHARAQQSEQVATDEAPNRRDAVARHVYTFPVVRETPRRDPDESHDPRW